jgi:hypothetical protein
MVRLDWKQGTTACHLSTWYTLDSKTHICESEMMGKDNANSQSKKAGMTILRPDKGDFKIVMQWHFSNDRNISPWRR